MKRSLSGWRPVILSGLLAAGSFEAFTQTEIPPLQPVAPGPVISAFDSMVASRIPILAVPHDAISPELPDSLDNSAYPWFPGILDQEGFFSCQQYSGSAYTFAYEINRLRDADGKVAENKYPPHYMWHFFNRGERYTGVSFLHTFHAMMEQGHMTNADFGDDHAQGFTGWINGYEKYYRAMHNRLGKMYRIPVNSGEGILAVKQYLYDHLDGSATGGVACFTASSPQSVGNGAGILPPGTPEAGKLVITGWQPYATHGMTLVGYHDSIRFDLNEDGQYTNHLDINGDGDVDARDWEIGGFRAANSYGQDWADQGYFYILYHAMASGFEDEGVWNNCVYVVEPDAGYTPLLTLKIELEHTRRENLNILAGVSADTLADYPEYILEPPVFNFQGGAFPMQGFDSLPEQNNLEFGIDVTPLLSFIESGIPARFYLVIEERDPLNTGTGTIHGASFIHYGSRAGEIPCTGTEVPVRNNGITMVSGTGTVDFPQPAIINEELPPLSPSGTLSVQFQAQGGDPPYTWNLLRSYRKTTGGTSFQPFAGVQVTPQSNGMPFAPVALPFPFQFAGVTFDTVFMNATGMIHFNGEHLPYPYLSSVSDMFDYIPALAPSFSQEYTYRQADGDGMWVSLSPDSARFRWKVSVAGEEAQTNVEFGATLFPDGKICFCYGPAVTGNTVILPWTGISCGDPDNTEVQPLFNPEGATGHSFTWIPPEAPASLTMSPDGYLTADSADISLIYTLTVRVTDSKGIGADRDFQLSDALLIAHELVSASGRLLFQEPATMDITVVNIGPSSIGPVELRLTCGSSEPGLTDSIAFSGVLAPGQSQLLEDAFSMLLESDLPDQTSIPFTISAMTPEKTRETSFCLRVSAPQIELSSSVIHDGVNGILEAGETAGLLVTLFNSGSLPAEELLVSLTGGDSLVHVISSPELGIASLGQKEMTDLCFTLNASRATPAGHIAAFELTISNGSGIDVSFPVLLDVGVKPIAIIQLCTETSSVELMTHMLDSLNTGYDLLYEIPADLNDYACMFLILGTTYTGSGMLTTEETDMLIAYLRNGGNVYMESYASWYYGTAEMLQPLFMFYTERVGVYNFSELEGVDGSFTEGMFFPYVGPAAFAIFEVYTKGEGFALMTNTDVPPKIIDFAFAGDVYRTIGTFKEFGKIIDSDPPSQKAILFKKYLDFLEVNIDGPFPFFHADTTHTCRWHKVQFTDDSFDNVVSWQWEFPGGDPAWSTLQNPEVTYHNPGVFDVSLTVSDGTNSRAMHKKQYIHVNVCTGMEEQAESVPALRLFPNPASSGIYLSFAGETTEESFIRIFDLPGREVLRSAVPPAAHGSPFYLDLTALSPGVYIVHVSGSSTVPVLSAKLILR